MHTTPVVAGNKCFIYHLESFETAFFPWSIASPFLSTTEHEKIRRIRKFLLNVLESPKCLAVVSHVQKTIESFRGFFNSDVINAKLHYCPIGFPIDAPREPSTRAKARFLFTASLHGNPANLLARGLEAVLTFIRLWRQYHPEDEFVFLSLIPQELLRQSMDDPDLLDVLRYPNVMSFDGQFLSEREFSRLLASCDFNLVPSYQLHSVSILRSMAAGVIPAVTDIREVRDYGLNDDNAVMIEVFDKVKREESEVFSDFYSLQSFCDLAPDIARQMVEKILPLRRDIHLRRAVATNAQQHIASHFSPAVAAVSFSDIVMRTWAATSEQTRIGNQETVSWSGKARFGPLSEFVPKMRPVMRDDFECRPCFVPQVDLGTMIISSDGRKAFAHLKGAADAKAFSFLHAVENYLPVDRYSGMTYPSSWAETTNSVFDVLMKEGPHGGDNAAVDIGYLKRKIFQFLHRRPEVKSALKRMGVHRVAKRMGMI